MPSAAEAISGRPQPLPVAEKHFVNGNRLAPPFPEGLELALFGMGCFWGAERLFWVLPGVWSTSVGYAGGVTLNPTYQEVCSGNTGHTEVVRVVFDPNRISYADLLKAFWESHDPTQGMRQGGDIGTQYRSAIYTLGDRQLEDAKASKAAYQRARVSRPPWRDHDGNRAGTAVLLRRGLSPAIPGEESGRLLRHWRNGRDLSRGTSNRAARRGLTRLSARRARHPARDPEADTSWLRWPAPRLPRLSLPCRPQHLRSHHP